MSDIRKNELHRTVLICVFLVALALPGAALGTDATYIRAGNVFDGETFLGPQVVVVRNGRIEAVEESGFSIPEGAAVVDARDATVMPGLIDGHIRFMAPPKPYEANIEKYGWGRLAAEEASAFPDNRRHLLANGITEIIDMGGALATYSGLRRALNRGSIVGPELYFSGPVITAPGGHPARTVFLGRHDLIDYGTFQVSDTMAVREEVATLANEGADFVEMVYTEMGTVPSRGPARLPGTVPISGISNDEFRMTNPSSSHHLRRLRLDVARAGISLARRIGVRIFAQVGSEDEAREMVSAGAHGIEGGFETGSDSLLNEMAARGVFFTPTIVALGHVAPERVPGLEQTVRRAWELGVPLVIGTDFPASGGANCGDDIFTEMRMFEEAGIPRFAVLRAATSGPAAKLGKADDLGRVASGYRANLVFLRGSADTGALGADRVERVMLQGATVVEDGRVCAGCEKGFRENSLSYLGYPYWDPLLSWMAGGTATDYDFLRTGVTAEADFMYSIRNMWFANAVFDLPSPVPRTALRAGMHFDNQNRLFYGLGNDTRLADTTEYSNLIFREWASGRTTISGPWKALSNLVFDQTKVSSYPAAEIGATKARNDTKRIGGYGQHFLASAAGRVLSETVAGNRGGDEIALTLALAHDTRDHQTNPWYGHYVSAGAQAAPAVFADGHNFLKVCFDARGYVSPVHRHVLAGRLLCQQAFGDVPFYYLPEFGGDTLGRGYTPFRFRDRVAVIGQLEYRFPIWSFISGVAFADFGQFQPDIGRFSLNGFHPAFGFGPRVCFGPNESSMVGIDVGITPEGWNLVLHNGQVF